jgi:hypothetical protein
MTLTDWIGFLGVTILLVAFFLNLINQLSSKSFTYIFLNLIGAAIACVASIMLLYWPFIILEGVWTLVSMVSLIRMVTKSTYSNK